MVCRIAELQYKEVIDISDGTRYGFVEDVELDPERGGIESIVVAGKPRGFGLLGRGPGQVFPWPSVKRFGADIILVDGKEGRGRDNPPAASRF